MRSKLPCSEMKMPTSFKVIASLVAIFVTGAITGSVITFQVVKRVVNARTNPDQWPDRVLREYKHRLDLTPRQMDQIRPKMAAAGRELKFARTDFAQNYSAILRQTNEDIFQALTPEQRERFKQFRREQMGKMRNRYPNLAAQPRPRPPSQQRPDLREMPNRRMEWQRNRTNQFNQFNQSNAPGPGRRLNELNRRPEFDDSLNQKK
jgi:hypothetical protein